MQSLRLGWGLLHMLITASSYGLVWVTKSFPRAVIAAAIIAASASDSVGTPARRTCVAAGAAIATKSGRIAAGGAPTAAARG